MPGVIKFFQHDVVIQAIGFLCFVLLLFALFRLDILPALRAKRAAKKQQEGELL